MYNRLKQQFESRTIAEMSIWYTLTAVITFLLFFLLVGCFLGFDNETKSKDAKVLDMQILLGVLLIWLIFIIWILICLVRIAWKSDNNRLGFIIFKYLQIGFLGMTLYTLIGMRNFKDFWNILSWMLIAFDIVIGILIFNFLVIAWFARCKISLKNYWEIASIIAMIVIQIFFFT